MDHEVFICYNEDDEKDSLTAKYVTKALEQNKIKCWLMGRDVIGNKIDETMDAIEQAKATVLVYSENAISSPFVVTVVNIAVEDKKPVLGFNVDGSDISGDLELYRDDITWLDASPNPEENFGKMVTETSKFLGKEITKPRVSRKVKSDYQGQMDELVNGPQEPPWYIKYKKPLIAGIILLILACGIFMYASSSIQNNAPSDTLIDGSAVKMKITDFHVDDVSKQGYSWNYSYFVGGSLTPLPKDDEGFVIEADYYDKQGNLVNTTETEFASVQKVNDGFLFGSTTSGSKDIDRVEVKLLNKNRWIYAQAESQL